MDIEPAIRICAECRYMREKPLVHPFGRGDYHSSAILEEIAKWEEEQNKTAILEKQMVDRGDDFDFEPATFPWCANWTEEEGRWTIDPISGQKSPIFVLCLQGNADGQCRRYEPKI
ncbi:hypothetical protein [Nitrospira sp. T9]|uniref:hypothetical protein n=1 Tax=unclassified Nitrospira TaxID=2652172 RepID=UPI003F9E2CCD